GQRRPWRPGRFPGQVPAPAARLNTLFRHYPSSYQERARSCPNEPGRGVPSPMPDPTDNSTESQRQAVFAALVEAQDRGLSVSESRSAIADRFDLSVQEVVRIEREGLDAGWPPL